MRRIDIDIGPDGDLSIDAVDFTGVDCERATRFLEDALGEPVLHRRKPAYRQRAAVRPRRRLGREGPTP